MIEAMKDPFNQPPTRSPRARRVKRNPRARARKPSGDLKLTPTLRCGFCGGIVDNDRPDTVCSGDCWKALVDELQITGLPEGIPRDEAIKILDLAGRQRKHIAAFYGISTARVSSIVRGEPSRQPRLNQSGLSPDLWLARKPGSPGESSDA